MRRAANRSRRHNSGRASPASRAIQLSSATSANPPLSCRPPANVMVNGTTNGTGATVSPLRIFVRARLTRQPGQRSGYAVAVAFEYALVDLIEPRVGGARRRLGQRAFTPVPGGIVRPWAGLFSYSRESDRAGARWLQTGA